MGGERALVDQLLSRLEAGAEGVEVGPGDDAAVVRVGERRLVLTTDSQREGVHYRESWLTPRQLGARAWAVAASDIAAMGAEPRWSLAALASSGAGVENWFQGVTEGIARAASSIGAPLVGGDVSESERAQIVVTVIGELPGDRPPLRRTSARPGLECWILGHLGWAAAGRDLLERAATGEGPERERFIAVYRRPRPPFALAAEIAEERLAVAAMDVSDGLAIDLRRMCASSGCGARIEREWLVDAELESLAGHLERDPLDWQVGGGDDYALLCAVEPGRGAALASAAGGRGVCATRIGLFVHGDGPPVLATGGGELPLAGGWDPFQRQASE